MSTHISKRKSFLWLLVSLITATVIIFSPGMQVALAWKPPEDLPPVEPPETGEPVYEPYAGGFDWRVPDRFGLDENHDGLIDYHYNNANFQYEKSWLYPESWPMMFDGCRTEQDAATGVSSTNTYTWVLNGETIAGNKCSFTYGKNSPNTGNLGFPAQGTYTVTLTVDYGEGITSPSGSDPEVFSQQVEVRDILIVSLGDSYASGEGVPDIRQKYHLVWGFPIWEADEVWQDQRCHRSANGGSALAARSIERMDPKTSVTFISYACSGATIGTEVFEGNDINKSRGVGILEPYIGQEIPDSFPYSSRDEGWVGYIPSQIGQLKDVLIPPEGKSQRQIDALTVSGGGNDVFFAQILSNCVLWEPCWILPTMAYKPGGSLYTPGDIVKIGLGLLSGRASNSVPVSYEHLAAEIATINPAPSNVYLMQYPNLFSAEGGGTCRMLEDILWPNPLAAIEPWESGPMASEGLTALNNVIFQKAYERRDQGWVYVDGLTNYNMNEADPNGPEGLFSGHGYCAFNHWIVRGEESELVQGPLYNRAANTGTAHPNILGNQAIRDRLLAYMVPNLFPQPPANPPEIGAPVYTIGDLVDEPGLNGWYVGSCDTAGCYPKAVLQVVGSAQAEVYGANVTIAGDDACSVSGVTCRTDGGISPDKKQYVWNIEINADGIYNFQFNLSDKAGAIATGSAEIKVDLNDPVLAPVGPFTINEGGTVALEASVSDSEGSPVSYTWDLNNDGDFETYVQKPEFSAASLDGPTSQIIQVMATDQAGRTATSEAVINVVNVAPTAAIIDAPVLTLEGTAINLDSWVSDPGAADTSFTYAWSVKKDGSDYTSGGTESKFSFTPNDNGSYEVSLSVTDDDGGVGTASKTIKVDNVAPAPKIFVDPTNSQEGTPISLTSSVTDPGTADTFTYAWTVKKNGIDYATGANASFSFTPDDNGSYAVSLSATDDDGGVGTASQDIVVANAAPVLSNISVTPGTVNEGGAITLSGSISDPGSADNLELTVNWGDGSAASTTSLPAGSKSFSLTHTYADDNPTGTSTDTNDISLSLKDDDNGIGTGSASVVVNNLAPNLVISTPANGTLYTINTSVSLSGAYSDSGTVDTHSCSVSWGDGTITAGALSAGICTASHSYSDAGVYNIQMTVADDDTGSAVEPVMVVVYDPSAGFVTGGGWINSPAGAYKPNEDLSGKATFGFVSRYQKGASVPTGNTAFQFQVGGFEFYSTNYEWLVVNQAATNAQFKGSGLINGAVDPNGKSYKFMLWAVDGVTSGGPDTFRIRIWWEDEVGEHDVYDNSVAQAIGGGSIVVHTSK